MIRTPSIKNTKIEKVVYLSLLKWLSLKVIFLKGKQGFWASKAIDTVTLPSFSVAEPLPLAQSHFFLSLSLSLVSLFLSSKVS